ncbi:unnamed protein product [Closterium sp. NIES-64]|nr:unnamed protein product [Closterium sp. NIES-64]
MSAHCTSCSTSSPSLSLAYIPASAFHLGPLVPGPLWPFVHAQPPVPSCQSWPCSPAALRASLLSVPTDPPPFLPVPIAVPTSSDSAPIPSGRLHAAEVSLVVATTPPFPCPAVVCHAASGRLPPAYPLANGAGRATATLLWALPPTAAACAVSMILPSGAPPSAAASLASDAPRHGFLHVPGVEPLSRPYSPPLLSVFLPRPRTARPSAAVLLTSASFRPSAPPAVARLLSASRAYCHSTRLGSVARDPSSRASPSSSSAVATVSACFALGARSPSSTPLGTWGLARVCSSPSCCGSPCSYSLPCSCLSPYPCSSPCSRSLPYPCPSSLADARAFSSLPRESLPPTPATSLITTPASPFWGAEHPFVARVAVLVVAQVKPVSLPWRAARRCIESAATRYALRRLSLSRLAGTTGTLSARKASLWGNLCRERPRPCERSCRALPPLNG